MPYKFFIFAFLVLGALNAAFFVPVGSSDSLSAAASRYNGDLADVPPPVRFLLSGERANVYVNGGNSFFVEFGDRGDVREARSGVGEGASIDVRVDRGSAQALYSGGSKGDFERGIRGGKISFAGRNLLVGVKMFIAMAFVNAGEEWDGTVAPGTSNLANAIGN